MCQRSCCSSPKLFYCQQNGGENVIIIHQCILSFLTDLSTPLRSFQLAIHWAYVYIHISVQNAAYRLYTLTCLLDSRGRFCLEGVVLSFFSPYAALCYYYYLLTKKTLGCVFIQASRRKLNIFTFA